MNEFMKIAEDKNIYDSDKIELLYKRLKGVKKTDIKYITYEKIRKRYQRDFDIFIIKIFFKCIFVLALCSYIYNIMFRDFCI
jgi:hypothetical protein